MEVRPGVRGIWQQPGEPRQKLSPWEAQWIWMSDDIASDMMLARRSFDFQEDLETALLRITATSQYQLYINGKFICYGPARSAPHHQSFDWLDITSLLRQGRNTIAVRVHYLQGLVSYHHSGRAGLLVQLELNSPGEARVIVTDSDWKVHPDPAWDNHSPRMNRFHLQVCDRFDCRLRLQNWESPEFDDGNWTNATPLLRNTGWPLPQSNAEPAALTPPWTSLQLRDVPYLIQTTKKALNLVQASTITGNRFDPDPPDLGGPREVVVSRTIDEDAASGILRYKEGKAALEVPRLNSTMSAFLLFDLGALMNARPRLEIEGPSGTVVDVLCAPYVLNETFTCNIVDSKLNDRLILSGNRDLWEAFYLKPTRFVAIVIRSPEGPVKIPFAGVRETAYPFIERGRLHTPENLWLERCWGAAAKTIRVSTTDAYTDNYRERRQYAQTGYYAALGNYAVFGDTVLQRRYLRQIAEEQQANGLMPAYAPLNGDDFMVILDSNCFWIRSLHDYLLYSGDRQTVIALLPAALRLIDLLQSYTNGRGLLDSPPFPYWLDHAVNDRRGANFCLNGHYLGALEDLTQVLIWLEDSRAEFFQGPADRLRLSLRGLFWNSDRKLFVDSLVDGDQSDLFSEHANAMALATGVATSEQARYIADTLLAEDEHDFIRRDTGLTMVTPAMSYFLHLGLCRFGYVEESLSMLQERFNHMLHDGLNGTLWEEWWLDGTGRSGTLVKGRTRSDAQTESAFPPALFAEFILGVRPNKPGFQEVSLFHSHSGLKEVEGEIPSPLGNLTVKWSTAKPNGGSLYLEIPLGMRVNLDLESLASDRGVSLDGHSLDDTSLVSRYLNLSEGKHEIEF